MNNLSISSIEVPRLYSSAIPEALALFSKSLKDAVPGDCVGTEVEILYDSFGVAHASHPDCFILKTTDGYESKSWNSLEKDDPRRKQMAPAFMDIAEIIRRIVNSRMLKYSLDALCKDPSGSEYFSLGIFNEGYYLIDNGASENLETLSWDHSLPTQDMIDSNMVLISPASDSAHERLQGAPGLSDVQDVLVDIYPLSWNETDPLPLSFRPAPLKI